MKRMSDENGYEAGQRNIGRAFLWAIPLILGLAASVWLGVWIDAHEFEHTLTQEQRAAVYVGAGNRPKSKVLVSILPSQPRFSLAYIKNEPCVPITKVDIDGSTLLMYARNDCKTRVTYLEWHWEEISPNGTVLSQHYTKDCATPTMTRDTAECERAVNDDSYEPSMDERTATIRVWTVVSQN